MKQNTKYMIGSVSSGTMREEDLIPAFLDCIRELDPSRGQQLSDEWLEITQSNPGHPGDEYETEDASMFLNETLFDALNEFSPPYFYFGSHPGDGADYGFWLSEDALEDFDGLKVSDLSEVPADYSGEVLHVNDHGNTSLYSCDNGKLNVVWELV